MKRRHSAAFSLSQKSTAAAASESSFSDLRPLDNLFQRVRVVPPRLSPESEEHEEGIGEAADEKDDSPDCFVLAWTQQFPDQLRISLVTTSRAWQGSFTDDGLLEHASQSGIKNPSLSTIQTLIRRAFRKPGRLEVSLASLASDSCELVLSYLMGRSGIQLLGSLELKIAPPRVIQQVLSSLMKHFQEQQCWAGSDSAEEERKSDGARDRKEEKRRALLRAIDSTGDEILSSSQLRQELDLAEQSIADLRAEIDRLRTCNRELSLVASGSSGSQFSSADQDSSLERLSASIPDRSIIAPHKRRRRQRGLKYK